MTVPLLTCIVAAYNAQRTLARTLGSLATSLRCEDMEVIVIDDGSTDQTAAVAQAFCSMYPHFRVIQQENRGLGAVRNRGVAEARGLYMTFCDADDIFLPDNQLALADRMERQVADVAVGTGYCIIEGREVSAFWDVHWVQRLARSEAGLPSDEFKHLLQPTVCTKLFRRGYVLSQSLQFTEGRLFEDVAFTAAALLGTRRIIFADLPVFIYDVHGSGSITSSRSMRRFEIFANVRHVFVGASEKLSPGVEATCLATSLLRTALWCLDNTPESAADAFERELITLFRGISLRGHQETGFGIRDKLIDSWDKRAFEALELLWWSDADVDVCCHQLDRIRLRTY